jgi:hypothetical protein
MIEPVPLIFIGLGIVHFIAAIYAEYISTDIYTGGRRVRK